MSSRSLPMCPSAHAPVALLCMALCLNLGCAHPVDQTPTDNVALGAEELDDLDFIYWLSARPLVRSEDAYRAMILLARSESTPANHDQLRAELESIVDGRLAGPPVLNLKPQHAVSHADAAYLLAKTMHYRSGVNWLLTGLPRYAHREMVYAGILSAQRSDHQLIRGAEMVDALRRADEWMNKRAIRSKFHQTQPSSQSSPAQDPATPDQAPDPIAEDPPTP